MRKIFLSLFIAMISFGLFLTDADAKRFGGGKSFGYNRSASSYNNASRAAPVAKPASSASKWLGPLAGLALGGMLASLFMGHGLGTGILSWLMIAAAAYFIWRLISRMRTPARNMNQAAYQAEPARVINDAPYSSATVHDTSAPPQNLTSFEEAAFLRQAKTTFIRLQAAYDNKNLLDIREFTAPQVFAEIQMQIQERGDEPNQTDVINVDAELLDFDLVSNTTTASVRFSGLIREQQEAQPEHIKEIWHFTKDKISQNWLVTGIQQD